MTSTLTNAAGRWTTRASAGNSSADQPIAIAANSRTSAAGYDATVREQRGTSRDVGDAVHGVEAESASDPAARAQKSRADAPASDGSVEDGASGSATAADSGGQSGANGAVGRKKPIAPAVKKPGPEEPGEVELLPGRLLVDILLATSGSVPGAPVTADPGAGEPSDAICGTGAAASLGTGPAVSVGAGPDEKTVAMTAAAARVAAQAVAQASVKASSGAALPGNLNTLVTANAPMPASVLALATNPADDGNPPAGRGTVAGGASVSSAGPTQVIEFEYTIAQLLGVSAAANAAAKDPSGDRASESALQSQMPALLWVSGPDSPGTKQIAPSAPAAAAVPARQSLAEMLGQRLQSYVSHGTSAAVIRLDPPLRGSIEITIRQDQGGVQIHMRASDGEVARQLQNIGDTLRQDLIQRQHGEVSVRVSEGPPDGHGRNPQRQDNPQPASPSRALGTEDDRQQSRFALAQPGSELT